MWGNPGIRRIENYKYKPTTVIASMSSDKAVDKIEHPFMIKILRKVGPQGEYLNIIKPI